MFLFTTPILHTPPTVSSIFEIFGSKKQQPVMRLFYNVPIKITLKINYLDFFCFSKLPMIKITFNINYLNFFCFPNFSRLLSTTFTFLCYDWHTDMLKLLFINRCLYRGVKNDANVNDVKLLCRIHNNDSLTSSTELK